MKKISLLFVFFIFAIFFFRLPKTVSAAVFFQDDFDDGDANGWTIIGALGWQVSSGEYGIHLNHGVSNSVPDDTIWDKNWVDYIYKVDLRGVYGTDKNVVFKFQDALNFYEIHHTEGLIYFEKEIRGKRYSFGATYFPLTNGPIYHVKIKIAGDHFEIYINDNLLFNVNDFEPSLQFGKIGLRVGTGAIRPSEVWYDNVMVCTLDDPCEPTPTLQPLIFLPGLGASWNHEAMILGDDKPFEDWYMTPGVKNYDSLIQTFKNAGYVEGNNFFVFNYDWRQPIADIAEHLESYIDTNINPPPETEIDLVGHSLGGIIARIYVQNNPSDHQVNQVITLGSPHHGAPQVYYLWEGADLKKTLSEAWQRIGAGILIHLKREPGETKVETVQRIVKVLGNLLPTFNYLKQFGEPISINDMNQENKWLIGLNDFLTEDLTSRLTTLLGRKGDTLRWINVKPQSWLDIKLDRWEDGKPTGEEFEVGDGTVLEESGQLEGASVSYLEGLNHSDLVETVSGQERIMEILGLTPTEIAESPATIEEPLLVFQLASPANISVLGPNDWQIGNGVSNNIPGGVYSEPDKLIIIPNPLNGDYQIQVNPENSGGEYKLLVGFLTSTGDYWKLYEGEVSLDNPDFHTFSKPDKEELESQILSDSKELVFSLKKEINGKRAPKKLRGKIISKLAVCMGNINAALELLEEGNNEAANKKTEKALTMVLKLIELLDGLENEEELKEVILDPLEELKDLLLQAEQVH